MKHTYRNLSGAPMKFAIIEAHLGAVGTDVVIPEAWLQRPLSEYDNGGTGYTLEEALEEAEERGDDETPNNERLRESRGLHAPYWVLAPGLYSSPATFEELEFSVAMARELVDEGYIDGEGILHAWRDE